MGQIIGYLKDSRGKKYKIEYIDAGLLHANYYRILDSNNSKIAESKSKESAIRTLEGKVGPVWKD